MSIDIRHSAFEIAIEAPTEKVWHTLVNRISEWWPTDFLCLEGAKNIILEAVAGGRLYEQTEDGKSLLWSTVVSLEAERSLEFAGFTTPRFGGPAVNMCRFELEKSESGTVLRFTSSVMGKVSDESADMTREGWTYLLDSFKQFAESN